ncbi:hypothetical protein KUCAC02_008043, partial [Chaenocephalus aceratus]
MSSQGMCSRAEPERQGKCKTWTQNLFTHPTCCLSEAEEYQMNVMEESRREESAAGHQAFCFPCHTPWGSPESDPPPTHTVPSWVPAESLLTQDSLNSILGSCNTGL